MSTKKFSPEPCLPRPAPGFGRPNPLASALLAVPVWLALTGPAQAAGAEAGLSSWQILPVLIGLFGLLLLGWLLTARFRATLAGLEEITAKMADCQLQNLVPEQNLKCRLTGRIGANINELALNLQEVLLLVWNLSHQDLEALNRISRRLDSGSAGELQRSQADLEFIRRDLEEMQEIVRQFEFFNVVLRDEKLLAKPEPATLHEREE